MKKILVIDPVNTGPSHLFFNSVVLSYLIRKRQVIFIAETNHTAQILDLLPQLKCKPFTSKYFLGRVFKGMVMLTARSFFKKGRILFLSLDNFAVPLLLLLLYPCLFRNSVSFIIHNNLTTLITNRFKAFLHNLVVKIYKAKIYVLTNEMKRIYDTEVARNNASICIPHPNYDELIKISPAQDILQGGKINIIILGRQAKIIAPWLNSQQLDAYQNLHFTITYSGKLIDWKKSDNITVISEKVSYNEYYSILLQADFTLFAMEDKASNRASGILMDSISMRCPVIAPRLGHFLELQNYGIGFFYNDYSELKNILALINEKGTRRVQYNEEFKEALNYSTPGNLERILI